MLTGVAADCWDGAAWLVVVKSDFEVVLIFAESGFAIFLAKLCRKTRAEASRGELECFASMWVQIVRQKVRVLACALWNCIIFRSCFPGIFPGQQGSTTSARSFHVALQERAEAVLRSFL